MKDILYCSDQSSKKKISLPFVAEKISKIKDISQKEQPLVVLSESILKRKKKLNPVYFRDKLCVIHFAK